TQKFELGLILRAKFAFPSSRSTEGVGFEAFPSVLSVPRGRWDGSPASADTGEAWSTAFLRSSFDVYVTTRGCRW
ncbi:hypothetical protein, partial [Sporisorium scitamineum]